MFSNALNPDSIRKIKKHANGRIHDVYGIGTYLTNDVGAKPLDIVIKMIAAKPDSKNRYQPVIKLSDDAGKQTGPPDEIKICRKLLDLDGS